MALLRGVFNVTTMRAAPALAAVATRAEFSTVFASVAEPISNQQELSSFGETKISTLLKSKTGDKGTWLWCTTEDTVLSAIKKMSKANVGSLIVMDAISRGSDAGNIKGILTERDYLTKIVLEGRNSSNTPVTDIMTPKQVVRTITPDCSVMEAMELMVEHQIRHLPVVEDDKLMGMVSIRDVVGTMVLEHRKSMDMMSSYISGTY